MSAKKKSTPGRQSSLLSFFGAAGGSAKKTANSPSTPTSSKCKADGDSKCKAAGDGTATVKADNSKEPPVIVVEDRAPQEGGKTKIEDDASATPSRAGSSKRRRAVIDSDSSPAQSESDADFEPACAASESDDDVDLGEVEEESLNAIKAQVKAKLQKKLDASAGCSTSTPKRAKLATATKSIAASPITPSLNATGNISEVSRSFLGSFRADESMMSSASTLEAAGDVSTTGLPAAATETKYKHFGFDFLKPDHIRDADKRRPDHPDYDRSTLHVPADFLKQQTPGHRQWWTMKARHNDTILFFKVGKFYELYHMDAVTAVQQLNLMYMKGDYAHCGFPEISYDRFANQLVARGYKVARIEQTETPAQLEERMKKDKSGGSREKVVRRELCRVTSAGTRTSTSATGGLAVDGAAAAHDLATAQYLLAIAERLDENERSTYGVCFVDTTVGLFRLGEFTDDDVRSELRTLLAHYVPAELLLGRSGSAATQQLLNTALSNQPSTHHTANCSAQQALKLLHSPDYVENGLGDFVDWPPALQAMLEPTDQTHQTAAKDCELAIGALGMVVRYLRECLIDVDMLSMRRFERYSPSLRQMGANQQSMLLDDTCLKHLAVVPSVKSSSSTTAVDISLFSAIDNCVTIFGKRQLRAWLCAPLYQVDSIRRRQQAVKHLHDADEALLKHVSAQLRQLPDLERLLQRLHSLGLKYRAQQHPDARAVLFEADKYNKRKVLDLLAALQALGTIQDVLGYVVDNLPQSLPALLRELCCHDQHPTSPGPLPCLQPLLLKFQNAFDHAQARSAGVIIPARGVDTSYDAVCDRLADCEAQLNDYLKQQRKLHACSAMSYFGTGKNRYQLEVPDAVAKRLGSQYEFKSQRKGFKRFTTASIDEMFSRLQQAEDDKNEELKHILRRILADFDRHYPTWLRWLHSAASLDVLLSFAKYGRSAGCQVCLPELVAPDAHNKPLLCVRDAVHPCLVGRLGSGDYIPNDVCLGCRHDDKEHGEACVLLLTGPNMGGKSSLMRTLSLLAVMAQTGCFVSASHCRLTPVDRIFTRIGASDKILAGESTFYVELKETRQMLVAGTEHSLLIVDELGRGTATHDGTAIAGAALTHLAERIQARTLFATHYHTLVDHVAACQNVKSMHMACMVENEDTEDPTDECVTFLFKLTAGPCPKSYGFFAAKLAGLPLDVIRRAHGYSRHTFTAVDGSTTDRLRRLALEHGDDDGALARAVFAI